MVALLSACGDMVSSCDWNELDDMVDLGLFLNGFVNPENRPGFCTLASDLVG